MLESGATEVHPAFARRYFGLVRKELWSNNRRHRSAQIGIFPGTGNSKMEIQQKCHDIAEYAVIFAIVLIVVVATIRLLST